MALGVRRVITGHDASGKAIVASDERMMGVSAPARPYISRCEIWSTDKMPVDNSDAAAAAQKQGDIVVQRGTMHAWVNNGSVPRVFAFILIDADPVEAGGQNLTTHYPTA